jgi:hypothetical protein
MKAPSFFACYHIFRTRHHWTVFQSVRYGLWLARSPGEFHKLVKQIVSSNEKAGKKRRFRARP